MSEPLDDVLAALVDRLAGRLAPMLAEALAVQVARPAPEPWRLLSVDEVAALLGRSRRWVYAAVKERGLPYVRLDGGALAFDPDDVRAWARDRRVPAADPPALAGRLQVHGKPARNGRSDGRRLTAMQKAGR